MSEMSAGRVISAPSSYLVILRQEFYEITGDAAAAALLNYYEYQYTRQYKYGGWHGIGLRNLTDRLFRAFGEDRLQAAYKLLMEQGFLEKRRATNPFMRAPEYRLAVPVVQEAVDRWAATQAGQIPAETPITGIRLSTTGSPASSAVNPVVDGVESGMSMTANPVVDAVESGRDSRSLDQILFSVEESEKEGVPEELQKSFEAFKAQFELQAGGAANYLRDMTLARVEACEAAWQWVIRIARQAMSVALRFQRLMTNILRGITGQAVKVAFEPRADAPRPAITSAADRYVLAGVT